MPRDEEVAERTAVAVPEPPPLLTPPYGGDGGPTPAAPKKKPRSLRRTLVEWVVLLGGALVIALLIKTFLFQAFYIPSESMLPTLEENDRVLVNKLSYKLHDVNRGDIVVFEAPDGEAGAQDLVKRVIGLPGETVSSCEQDRVCIDDRPLDEPYLPGGTTTSRFAPVKVPDGTVFVMGDNRNFSKDSRSFGPIGEDSIVGRVFVRIWPPNRLGLL